MMVMTFPYNAIEKTHF